MGGVGGSNAQLAALAIAKEYLVVSMAWVGLGFITI